MITPSLEYKLKRKREEYELQLRKIIIKEVTLYKEHKGQLCPKCNIIQGEPYLGFYEYYCGHLERKIEKKIKKDCIKSFQILIQSLGIEAKQ